MLHAMWRTVDVLCTLASGAVERWSGGAVELWSGGAVERWSGGAVELWSGGAVELWSCGALWSCEAVELKSGRAPPLGHAAHSLIKILSGSTEVWENEKW